MITFLWKSRKDDKVRCKLCTGVGVHECWSMHYEHCELQSSFWRETDIATITKADFTASVDGWHKEHIDVCLLKQRYSEENIINLLSDQFPHWYNEASTRTVINSAEKGLWFKLKSQYTPSDPFLISLWFPKCVGINARLQIWIDRCLPTSFTGQVDEANSSMHLSSHELRGLWSFWQ